MSDRASGWDRGHTLRLRRVSEVGRVVAWRRRRQHPSLTLDGSLRTRLDALGQRIELTGEVNWEPLSSGR